MHWDSSWLQSDSTIVDTVSLSIWFEFEVKDHVADQQKVSKSKAHKSDDYHFETQKHWEEKGFFELLASAIERIDLSGTHSFVHFGDTTLLCAF